ncbi:beta propeller repeat protein [Dinghuibacter silviterrae]|uniref:oxidoreductase n=1 Tax=Dinghuibacter silviterrae TaxID=1539049 RepID=UPI001063871C|nr:oxidoreductase [Dinghuibacter silviterrae]
MVHAPTSFRGLSVQGSVIWVSGTGGTVGRSTDGGSHFFWTSVPGFAKKDFRDIEAFDSSTAVIMGIDTPAVILRTTDGGVHWTEVFRDGTPGMFLDAMSFKGAKGIVVGDPVHTFTGDRFYLAMTINYGKTWTAFSDGIRPPADSGEGCFASSGTNIRLLLEPGLPYVFVSGGPSSRVFTNVYGHKLPLIQGFVSTGANSIATDGAHWVIVGGDFAHDTVTRGNCVYSVDGGAHWLAPHTPPHGYRSCVVHVSGDTWLCCGTSGIDVSNDGGDHWKLVSRENFHVAAVAGRTVYLAGARGRVSKLDL